MRLEGYQYIDWYWSKSFVSIQKIQRKNDNHKSTMDGKVDENNSTPCELKCQKEQSAIKACVQSIRAESEAGSSSPSSECLQPVVAAWTTCCAKANSEAGLIWGD